MAETDLCLDSEGLLPMTLFQGHRLCKEIRCGAGPHLILRGVEGLVDILLPKNWGHKVSGDHPHTRDFLLHEVICLDLGWVGAAFHLVGHLFDRIPWAVMSNKDGMIHIRINTTMVMWMIMDMAHSLIRVTDLIQDLDRHREV